MSVEFLVTTLIVVLLPGTGVIYTLAAGLTQGARAAGLAAFGCTLGILPHVAASVAGLAALLHASAVAFEVIKYLGVAYLFYMAWQMWRDTGALAVLRLMRRAAKMRVERCGSGRGGSFRPGCCSICSIRS